MALLQLPLRLKAETHAALHDDASRQKKAAGKIIGEILWKATNDDVVNAFKIRLEKGETVLAYDKRSLALVSEPALNNLAHLSDISGLPKDFLVRLLVEAHLQNPLPTHQQNQ